MKTDQGNYFEDFQVGQQLIHATPRTAREGDITLYTGLFPSRFAVQSSNQFASDLGYSQSPIDDLLTFHIVFGKTVPDISLNAVANLGYAEGKFLKPVYPGDTLRTISKVIGKKENSNGKTGVVYVRSEGFNQMDECVLSYVRWVMVRKKDPASQAPEPIVPKLSSIVEADQLGQALPHLDMSTYDYELSGATHRWDDYEIGEQIDHVDGMTVEEAEHQIATRLFQNTAKVHFNQHTEAESRFGKRLIYGGHVISLARALSYNGLQNGFHITAINAGQHVAPLFSGDTVYAWSEILDKQDLNTNQDMGALRIRTVACKNQNCSEFPYKTDENKYSDGVILDLDYWICIPK